MHVKKQKTKHLHPPPRPKKRANNSELCLVDFEIHAASIHFISNQYCCLRNSKLISASYRDCHKPVKGLVFYNQPTVIPLQPGSTRPVSYRFYEIISSEFLVQGKFKHAQFSWKHWHVLTGLELVTCSIVGETYTHSANLTCKAKKQKQTKKKPNKQKTKKLFYRRDQPKFSILAIFFP